MSKRLLMGAVGAGLVLVGMAAPASAQPRSAKADDTWKCQVGYAYPSGVSIHKYPNKGSKTVGAIPQGEKATCHGQAWSGNSKSHYKDCGGGSSWVYVSYQGKEGWSAAECLYWV